MRTVVIATPSYDGRNICGFTAAVVASAKECLARNINLVPLFVCYDAKVHNARNDLLAMCVNTADVSDLIWIDDDTEWAPAWILRLLDHPVDVVGGAVPNKDDAIEGYNVGGDLRNLKAGADGLIPVRHLGTGFLRLSRKAFVALWDKAPPYDTARGKQRRVFGFGLQDGAEIGEDVGMCHRLRELGFAIHLDPLMTCRHTGIKTWGGDFAAWLARAHVAAASEAKRKTTVRNGKRASSRASERPSARRR